METQVYVGLGGNVGDSEQYLNSALEEIEKIYGVNDLKCSSFYQTTPVGSSDQGLFINAVCGFNTSLTIKEIHCELRRIESKLGKVPKPKDHPRVIDLDLLFFGEDGFNDEELHVPDRLFVLVPLSDLVTEILVPEPKKGGVKRKINIQDLLETFLNKHDETVTFLTKPRNERIHS